MTNLEIADIGSIDTFIEETEKIVIRLEELSSVQTGVLRKKETGDFLAVIEQKSLLVNAVIKLTALFKSKMDDPEWKKHLKNDLYIKKLKNLQLRVADLIRLDHDCLRLSMSLKDSAYSELTTLIDGKKTLNSYKRSSDSDLNIGWKG